MHSSLVGLFSGIFLLAGKVSATNHETTAPAGTVMTHVVRVGAGGALTFTPEKIKANPGDLVQFHFYPKAHSVAQSSFDNPCQPLDGAGGATGFWSGFQPVDENSKEMPVFTIPVNSTKPIWFYCATGKHCQGGMVGVINEPADKKIETYKTAAKAVAAAGVPGGAAGGPGGTYAPPTGGNSSVPNPTREPPSDSTVGAGPSISSQPQGGDASSYRAPSMLLCAAMGVATWLWL